ncbi:MAG: hypothetical protein V2I97_05040 [Desulfococcaceae bacterium]|jgi:hypothetical protein|nr:hypothetical protein [Desulfococcaceae bacterium]
MNHAYDALSGRMKTAMKDLESVVSRAELMAKKAKQSGDDCYLDGAALNLHGFYSGTEQIFEDIARTVDKSVPQGLKWHKDLLMQMGAELPAVRPAVIPKELRYCLEEYLAFRHVVRNVYSFHLKSERLMELVTGLRPCYNGLRDHLEYFSDFLKTLNTD